MKKYITLFILLLNVIAASSQTPHFDWAKQLDSNDVFVTAMTTDKHGALYITGTFDGTVDFDPGAGITTATDAGFGDIFILKLDSTGNFDWVKTIGGTSYDEGDDIAIDSNGNVIVAGLFSTDSIDFDPGPGVFLMSASENTFILKLDANGNFIWAKSIASPTENYVSAMHLDKDDNIVLVGKFGGVTDFDPGSTQFNITAVSTDIYICKLDINGDFIWAKHLINPSANTSCFTVTTDQSNNIILAGLLLGTTDFDPGSNTVNLTNTSSNCSYFLKLDANGNFVWVNTYEGTDMTYGKHVLTDAINNIYLAGFFIGTVNFNLHSGNNSLTSGGATNNSFLLKLDSNANYQWVLQLNDLNDITLHNNHVYTCGNHISKYDSAGFQKWTIDSSLSQRIVTDNYGNVFTTGTFSGTVDFDPGMGVYNLSSNSSSVFIQKLNDAGITDIKTTPSKNDLITIYPNPNNGQFYLRSSVAGHYKIINSLGQFIKNIDLPANQNTRVQLEGVSAGMYYIADYQNGGKIIAKIVVE